MILLLEHCWVLVLHFWCWCKNRREVFLSRYVFWEIFKFSNPFLYLSVIIHCTKIFDFFLLLRKVQLFPIDVGTLNSLAWSKFSSCKVYRKTVWKILTKMPMISEMLHFMLLYGANFFQSHEHWTRMVKVFVIWFKCLQEQLMPRSGKIFWWSTDQTRHQWQAVQKWCWWDQIQLAGKHSRMIWRMFW